MNNIKLWIFKLRIILRLLKKQRGLLVKTCGICEGILFDTLFCKGATNYIGKVKCCKCGAYGEIQEKWKSVKEE